MTLRTKNLTYSVDEGYGSRLRLLNPTSVTLPKNSVTAIMGPSGAGKTTLMDLISGTKRSGYYSGDIFVGNNQLMESDLKSVVAHVECFDFHIEEFTVLENMYYTAMLRVGRWMSHDECLALCLEIADIISLTPVLDVFVGSELKKGISGGQKKLLSIANELLAFPTVLCLDEPTSGLDSTTSLQLAYVLDNLARKHHKTIICTIHQPSAEMLAAWQYLVLIGQGSIVYEGAIAALEPYLAQIGYSMPPKEDNITPVEYVVHLMSIDADVRTLIDQWDAYATNDLATTGPSSNSQLAEGDSEDDITIQSVLARQSLPIAYQIIVLTLRHALYTWRTLHGIRGMFARNILGGVFYGIVYYKNGNELAKLNSFVYPDKDGLVLSPYVYNSVTACFAVPLFIVVINMVPIPSMFAMSRYCNKEQANRLYSSFARWLSLLLVDLPVLFLGTCCFILLMYKMSEVEQDWFHFSYIVMLGSLLGYAQAQLCAHISHSAIQGFVFMAVLCVYQLVFSGYFVEKSDLPRSLRWAVYTSFMRWSVGQLMMNQFGGYLRHQGDLVLEMFEYENFEFSRSAWVVVIYFVGLELLILLALFFPKPSAKRISMDESGQSIGDKPVLAGASRSTNGLLRSSVDSPLTDSSNGATVASGVPCPPSVIGLTVDGGGLEKEDVFTAAKSLEQSRMVNFLFQRITYTLKDKWSGAPGKQLLKGIDGVVNSGELCAIMGMSGSGKTTLLNVLAGRANVGTVEGVVHANSSLFPGMKIANSVAQADEPTYAYVMQDDAHFPLFTVQETLEFAAMLRQRTTSRDDVRDMVEETLLVLGLSHIADHYVGVIGDSMISRGQLRRLTVGVEIVNSPSLVFLDEPTTGLDSFLAGTVVKGLKTLAGSGRTVLCTIHSPSPSLFVQFDKLLLLSEGRVLYFGPAKDCEQYLRIDCGFAKLTATNPADFVIQVARETKYNTEACLYTLEQIAAMAKKRFYGTVDILRDASPVLESDSSSRSTLLMAYDSAMENISADLEDIRKSRVTIRVLLVREFLKELRRYRFWVIQIIRAVALGCLLGYAWGDLTPDGSILNYTGLTLVIYITVNLWMVEIVPILQEDKVVFYRERDANATSTFASWLVMNLPTSCALAFVILALLLTVYEISDLRHGTKYFLQFYFVLYIQLIANLHLGVFVSTFTPNTMVNVLIFPSLTLTIQAMLCGYAAMITTFKPWYRWITYIIPAKYYMGILFISQLKGDENISADFDSILSDYGWDYPMRDQFVYLLLILVVHKFLAYLGMRYLTSAKQ